MSEPRKYGDVCHVAVRNNKRLSPSPQAAAIRTHTPSSTAIPIAISATATPTPAPTGHGANLSSTHPAGASRAKPSSWVPMYVGAPACK